MMKKIMPYFQFVLSAISFLSIIFFIFGYVFFEFTKRPNFTFFEAIPMSIIYLLIAIAVISNLPFLKGIITEIVKDKVETETLEKVKKYCFQRIQENPDIIIEMNRHLDDYQKNKSKAGGPKIDNLNLEGEKDAE